MTEQTIRTEILNSYPAVDETALDAMLATEIAQNDIKFVVLDDDPTGVQTVHGISVYTDWTVASMEEGLQDPNKLFYVLTNSRGMTPYETTRIHKEIIRNVGSAARNTGIRYQFISRSDSTLRGHYPLETEILRDGVQADGGQVDGEILCPFFKEGGRYTIGNVHYVRYGDELVPAAQTEFARDASFGYAHSDLPGYIEEKTQGRNMAQDVNCIALEDLRAQRMDVIENQLMQVHDFGKICVNAIDYCDLKVFCIALYRAMAHGKTFMIRSAAGIVKVIGGIKDQPLLTRDDMIQQETNMGGVVVVGSHTARTTAQLQELLELPGMVPVQFRSSTLLESDEAFEREIERCVAAEEQILRSGKTAVCYTERQVLSFENDTKESALRRSVRISDGVQRLVGELRVTPTFIVAKGGITSSDVGTKALHVRKALVMGQICPGIPVWQTGDESRFPGIPYIIFPGNVGSDQTLQEAVAELTGAREEIGTEKKFSARS